MRTDQRPDPAPVDATERSAAAIGYTAGARTDAATARPGATGGGLEWREDVGRGSHPGDRYIRVARHRPEQAGGVGRVATVARDPVPPKTPAGRLFQSTKRALIGLPLTTAQGVHERLTKVKALAILSSDAISSVAYGPEAALLVLSAAGASALRFNLPIMVAIALLLAIVTFSYRQTIFAYPSGGGSYIVASENLGRGAGLTAAAALLIDYILTVAVSIASGVAALVSAVPELTPYGVPLGLLFIALLVIGNLRGIRESGTLFAAPTYLFIGSLAILVVVGFVRVVILRDPVATGIPREPVPGGETLGVLLILRAFASGCTSMTGVEAVSNGVPAFQKPESRNAATTMLWMSGILGVLLLGIAVLAQRYGLVPSETGNPTLLSQLTELVVGHGLFYYVVQFGTLLVLVLAANTAYADFPRLASILAKDRFLPRQFAFRGDRLAFSVGIGALSVFAAILLVLFRGNVEALIPLFAVGVFVSFTMSQSGMVVHWWRERGPGWAAKAAINGTGAVVSALVALVAGGTKLISGEPLFHAYGRAIHAGSWIVIVLIPVLITGMLRIERHYARYARVLATETPLDPTSITHTVVVPIAGLDRVALQTLAYACTIPGRVSAVHVSDDPTAIAALREGWDRLVAKHPFLSAVDLALIESPYRALTAALLAYIDEIDARQADDTLTVVLPEYVPAHWWEQLLHGQTALRLKAALLFRPGTVVISVPYHMAREEQASA